MWIWIAKYSALTETSWIKRWLKKEVKDVKIGKHIRSRDLVLSRSSLDFVGQKHLQILNKLHGFVYSDMVGFVSVCIWPQSIIIIKPHAM